MREGPLRLRLLRLLAFFFRQVMAHHTTTYSADYGMMPGVVAGYTAHNGAFQASFGTGSSSTYKQDTSHQNCNQPFHRLTRLF
jgi:hypothetical protein